MKNTVIVSVVSALAICAATSCGQPEQAPVQGSRTGFALSFFKSVSSVTKPGENVAVSPYSAGVAFSMLYEGAQGQTRVELDNALNGCLFVSEDLGGGDTVKVKSANSVWIDDDFSVRNNYVDLLQKDYDALVTTLNFADPATLRAINNWSAENTDGKIKEILSSLSPQTTMVLADALYFSAPWLKEFNPDHTRDAVFHGVSGEGKVRMMYQKSRFNYGEYQGCQLVELPYVGGRYSMLVVLPPEGISVDSVLPYVNEAAYNAAMASMTSAQVSLSMPKMRLETSLVLNDAMKKMGVTTAFSPAADFKGISVMGPLVLDTVSQKCYIDITESGTEAAAVTVATISLTSLRPDVQLKKMTVDRPFVFLITDKTDGDIMFIGKILNL